MKAECNTELLLSWSTTSLLFSTCSWTSLTTWFDCIFSTIISFSCSNICWADVLWLQHIWSSLQCSAFHWQAIIGMSIYVWNTINSILSIRPCCNTNIIFLPTIVLSLQISTCLRTFQSPCLVISSCTYLALTPLVEVTFADLVIYMAISFPVAIVLPPKHIFQSCRNLNL